MGMNLMPDPKIFPIVSVNDTFFTVTGVSQICLAENPDRGDADFINDRTDLIYLARGNDAVIGSGISLNTKGGSYHIGTDNRFYGDIYAINDDAQNDSILCISEGDA